MSNLVKKAKQKTAVKNKAAELKKAKQPAKKNIKLAKIKHAKPIKKAAKKVVRGSKSKVTTSKTQAPKKTSKKSAAKYDVYMDEKQLEYFKSSLLKWKAQIMAEVDRTVNHMQEDVVNYPDPVDRANQEEEFSLELRTRDRERKLMRKIDEALGRINDGDYGYCDDCGAEIGVRRLEARPTATQCIECKTIAEVREKQLGENH